MDENVIDDLKQFISSTIHQEIVDVREDITKLDLKLTTKIEDLTISVAEAFDTTYESVDKRIEEHGLRITKLEQKAA